MKSSNSLIPRDLRTARCRLRDNNLRKDSSVAALKLCRGKLIFDLRKHLLGWLVLSPLPVTSVHFQCSSWIACYLWWDPRELITQGWPIWGLQILYDFEGKNYVIIREIPYSCHYNRIFAFAIFFISTRFPTQRSRILKIFFKSHTHTHKYMLSVENLENIERNKKENIRNNPIIQR